jgi:hypothetical protein
MSIYAKLVINTTTNLTIFDIQLVIPLSLPPPLPPPHSRKFASIRGSPPYRYPMFRARRRKSLRSNALIFKALQNRLVFGGGQLSFFVHD